MIYKFLIRACDELEYVGAEYLECKEIVPGLTKSLIYVYPNKNMDIGGYFIAEFDEILDAWISCNCNFFNGLE